MSVSRIQHVSIPRPPGDEAANVATQFYRDVLGCAELPPPHTLTGMSLLWFRCGDDEIHVYVVEQGEGGRPEGHFGLVVDDLEAMRARLEGAGYHCETGSPIPHRPRIFTRDPFGNVIELATIDGDYRMPRTV